MTVETDVEETESQRLGRIEARLRLVEDQLAIAQLIASYGPLVDSGDPDGTAALWTEEGTYEVGGYTLRGRRGIAAMVRSEPHQAYINGGSVHFQGPPWVRVEGDTATAVCESLLVLHGDAGFRIERGGASHFELARVADGWRIVRRRIELLDGRESARALLAHGA